MKNSFERCYKERFYSCYICATFLFLFSIPLYCFVRGASFFSSSPELYQPEKKSGSDIKLGKKPSSTINGSIRILIEGHSTAANNNQLSNEFNTPSSNPFRSNVVSSLDLGVQFPMYKSDGYFNSTPHTSNPNPLFSGYPTLFPSRQDAALPAFYSELSFANYIFKVTNAPTPQNIELGRDTLIPSQNERIGGNYALKNLSSITNQTGSTLQEHPSIIQQPHLYRPTLSILTTTEPSRKINNVPSLHFQDISPKSMSSFHPTTGTTTTKLLFFFPPLDLNVTQSGYIDDTSHNAPLSPLGKTRTGTPSLGLFSTPSYYLSIPPDGAVSFPPSLSSKKNPSYAPTNIPSFVGPPSLSFHLTTMPSKEPNGVPSILSNAIATSIPSSSLSLKTSNDLSPSPHITFLARPSQIFTTLPSLNPITGLSLLPTVLPSLKSSTPTFSPSLNQSTTPTYTPSLNHSTTPTYTPSLNPSTTPTFSPSLNQSTAPTFSPSLYQSTTPTFSPSLNHSTTPTLSPSLNHSITPTLALSFFPSAALSLTPSSFPSQQPTLVPSFFPSSLPSLSPSDPPSYFSSTFPSIRPSFFPSLVPSINPTLFPSLTQNPSLLPSLVPTSYPSHLPSFAPSNGPTVIPTFNPTSNPTLSMHPSVFPSNFPSENPTDSPSVSLSPSQYPSMIPSTSFSPSQTPSILPSTLPTTIPSRWPTPMPSFDETTEDEEKFEITLTRLEYAELFDDQIKSFNSILESYTGRFASAANVESKCEIIEQDLRIGRRRKLTDFYALDVTFVMTYKSQKTNVNEYCEQFQDYMNLYNATIQNWPNNLALKDDLNNDGISVEKITIITQVNDATIEPFLPPTDNPSIKPTEALTLKPTSSSPFPTISLFHHEPSSSAPTQIPSPHKPDFALLSPLPSFVPSRKSSALNSTIAAAAAGSLFLFSGLALTLFVVRRRRRKELLMKKDDLLIFDSTERVHNNTHHQQLPYPHFQDFTSNEPRLPLPPTTQRIYKDYFADQASHDSQESTESEHYMYPDGYHHQRGAPFMTNHEEIRSNQSLVSAGYSVSSDSILENDATNMLVDVFDRYRDQNLEQMREELEGTFENSDDMLSQAMTRVYMMDEADIVSDFKFSTATDVLEIEVSELWATNDWKKKNQGASDDEKNAFLQEVLNRTVVNVRHGLIQSHDATRTIFGCTALLGLLLTNNMPKTTLIVTGLRKTAQKSFLADSFSKFGELEGVAVAPEQRGFGLVRFKSVGSVQKALDKFHKEEIVVQDVGVMIKVLESETPLEYKPMPHLVPINVTRDAIIKYPDGSLGGHYDLAKKHRHPGGSGSESGRSANSNGSKSQNSRELSRASTNSDSKKDNNFK